MSDKKLLEESTIRRFMKLANINGRENDLLSEGVGTPFDKKVSKSSKNSIKVNGRKPGKGMVRESDYRMEEDQLEEVDDMPMDDSGGMDNMYSDPEMDSLDSGGDDNFGAEGGDTKTKVESAVETLKNALNDILDAVDSDKRVEDEDSEEMDLDEPGDEADFGDEEDVDSETEEAPVMEASKDRKKDSKKEPEKEPKKELEEDQLEESIELVDEELIETLLKRVTERLVKESKAKSSKRYDGHGAGLKQGTPFNNSAGSSSKNSIAVNSRKKTSSVNNKKR